MIEGKGTSIYPEPGEGNGGLHGHAWGNLFEMESAFIPDVPGYKISFAQIPFDLGEKMRHALNSVYGDDMRGVEEEIASFLPAVGVGSLKQDTIRLLFKQRVVFCGKRYERGK